MTDAEIARIKRKVQRERRRSLQPAERQRELAGRRRRAARHRAKHRDRERQRHRAYRAAVKADPVRLERQRKLCAARLRKWRAAHGR